MENRATGYHFSKDILFIHFFIYNYDYFVYEEMFYGTYKFEILEHALWGTNAFVGTIFTDAPLGSAAVGEILDKVNAE